MNRSTFLQRLGLGALAGLVPWRAKAETPDPTGAVVGMSAALNAPEGLAEALGEYRAPSWRMEGDWTVVYAPTIIRPDEAFEPHLLVPGCPKSFLVATDVIVVDSDGVRRDRTMAAHTATDRLAVYTDARGRPFEPEIEFIHGPFWLFWPDEWVVLVSTGAAGVDLPVGWVSEDRKRAATIPRQRTDYSLGWL